MATRPTRPAARASGPGTCDAAYASVDTPLGALLLAATDEGLVRVAWAGEDRDSVLDQLADAVGPRLRPSRARLDGAARQVEEYFARRRTVFDLALDLRLARGFRGVVLGHLLDVAYGTTASYADIAAAAGSPKAVRAVGTACATNPLPVVVPCHRVVRGDGSVGGYLAGTEAKKALLALEADVSVRTRS